MMIKNLKPFGPNKEENILRVETGEDVKFPEDYREFLLTIGGGIFHQVRNPNAGLEDGVTDSDFRPIGIPCESNGEKFTDRFEILFGCIRQQNLKYDIENTLWQWDGSEEAYGNSEKVIPIGRTEYGNTLIMFLNKKEYGQVVYYDHECLLDDFDGEPGLYILANSFTEFVEILNDKRYRKSK